MIYFKEHSKTGYKWRTIDNAKADITIAFAIDFSSFGEILTKNSVISHGKKYIPVDVSTLDITEDLVTYIINEINSTSITKDIFTGEKIGTLNIAGNGIYTLKGKYTQEQCDSYLLELLTVIINDKRLSVKIVEVVSGGQTGFDEAGTKAADKIQGIKSTVLAPNGWLFRDITGKDITNELLFKKRFK
jgi:hypothetical protein